MMMIAGVDTQGGIIMTEHLINWTTLGDTTMSMVSTGLTVSRGDTGDCHHDTVQSINTLIVSSVPSH